MNTLYIDIRIILRPSHLRCGQGYTRVMVGTHVLKYTWCLPCTHIGHYLPESTHTCLKILHKSWYWRKNTRSDPMNKIL